VLESTKKVDALPSAATIIQEKEQNMVAKVYADRRSADPEPEAPTADHDLETEVQAVAAWFEALPAEWQRYLDHEARAGRQAYGRA
jgi:hypothetical protein